MNKNPIDQTVQAQYDKLWNNEWRYLLSVGPGVQTRLRIILKFIKKYMSHGSIIDIGCGDGKLLSNIYKTFNNNLTYNAAEISQSALDIVGKNSFIESTLIMDITNSSTLPQRAYTGVVASEVLEHIDDWKGALLNISNLVDSKGFIFITVPALMKHMSAHDVFAHHYRRFEIGELENALRQLNFDVLENLCWGWPIYSLYYSLVLNRIKPDAVMQDNNSLIKHLASTILYYLFFIDDLFPTPRGRRLFIVAKRKR